MLDVVVIGAGLAGLFCAQTLQKKGLSVAVVEKSRGLGGRLATRRLPQAFADHGVRCLEVQGELSQELIQRLCDQALVHPWTEVIHQWSAQAGMSAGSHILRYASATGITAAAKFLATGLDVRLGQRVQAIALMPAQTWELTLDTGDAAPEPSHLAAKAVVVAIPAPQALMLLEPLPTLPREFLAALRSVEFDPCLTAIAAFSTLPDLPWKAITCHDPAIAWVSLESTKSPQSSPTLVVQSSAAFAAQHLEASDLQPMGHLLMTRVAQIIPDLGTPDILQVHRWRYAFARQPLPRSYLMAAPLALVCAGDWCGGMQVESALQSGLAAARAIAAQLQP